MTDWNCVVNSGERGAAPAMQSRTKGSGTSHGMMSGFDATYILIAIDRIFEFLGAIGDISRFQGARLLIRSTDLREEYHLRRHDTRCGK